MARGRSTDRGQRDDIFDPSLAELLAPLPTIPRPVVFTTPPSAQWREIEDWRVFDPEGDQRSPRSFSGNVAPSRRIPATDRTWSSIGFSDQAHAMICARRKVRREVMFAKRRHRRGGGGRRRRNFWSNVRC